MSIIICAYWSTTTIIILFNIHKTVQDKALIVTRINCAMTFNYLCMYMSCTCIYVTCMHSLKFVLFISQVDVFSFAMFLYELVSLQFPFERQNLMHNQIEKLIIEGDNYTDKLRVGWVISVNTPLQTRYNMTSTSVQ